MSAPATSAAKPSRSVAALPALPNDANISPQLLARLQAVVERIATLDGQRGDALDAALTKRDLVDVGLLKVNRSGNIDGLNDNTFSGGWTNIPYLESMPVPTAPTVTTMVGVNYLFWQLPNARGVGATEIMRHTGGDSVIVGRVVGAQFVDLVEPGVVYAYKIRFISELGVAGDWSAEVTIAAEDDPTDLLSVLQGRINESELAQSLRERVTTGGTIDTAIGAERAARIEAVNAEAQARVAAIEAETSARVAALLAEASARETAITSEATARTTADESLAQSITTLTSNTADEFSRQTAAIQSEATARTTADESLAQSISTLASQTSTDLGVVTAAITAETTARTDADEALSLSITTLSASVADNSAAIVSESRTRADEDVALSEMLDSLTVKVDDAYAAMVEQIRANATADSATVEDLSLALARIAASESAITSEQRIRSEADSALSDRVTTLSTKVDDNYATIVNNYYTRTTTDTAITAAERRAVASVYNLDTNGVPTTLTVSFSEKIKTEVNASGVAKATFESKVTAGQRTAGFAYGTDGNVSEFYVNADRFAVLSNSGTKQTTPFIVEGDKTYINSAIIKDASIDTAKIKDLNTTVATIAKANLYDAAVGGQIYSSNYNLANKTGWSLNQDGSAFFGGNTTFGGKLEVRRAGSGAGVDITNDGIRVYDSLGRLRVAIGRLA